MIMLHSMFCPNTYIYFVIFLFSHIYIYTSQHLKTNLFSHKYCLFRNERLRDNHFQTYQFVWNIALKIHIQEDISDYKYYNN